MKVICIENKNLMIVNSHLLTIGKEYELLKVEDNVFWVIDDEGEERHFDSMRFYPNHIELELHLKKIKRTKRLNKLGI